MTIEEAIKALSLMERVESIAAAYDPGERRQDTTVCELKEACRMASEAFRAQQVHTKMDRSQWEGCPECSCIVISRKMVNRGRNYCPYCGRPLTEEAWAELERRINGG